MSKILVTGAGGYIGRYVVKKLLNFNFNVIAVNLNTDEIDKRAQIIEKNIFEDFDNDFSQLGNPDICIHLAWRDGFIHNSHNHMGDLSNHYNFLKKIIDAGISQLIILGSMHEVGYYEGAIDEYTPCNPITLYGIAKDSLRRSIQLLTNEKNIVFQWLRAFYIYGDDCRSSSIFSKILFAAGNGQKEFPFTTGKNLYDFIHVEQLASQIAACANQSEITGIINCCTGKPVSLAEKVENFIKDNDLNIKLSYGSFPDREYDSPGIWGDNKKIMAIINKQNVFKVA